jgi:large subunit ribosomal protein L15
MKLDEILQKAGKHKGRRRVGRGNASGQGKSAGRGDKGAHSRAGATLNLGFEGGQNPILARIPKRGFNNASFRNAYQVVNIRDLDRFDDGARVDAQALKAARLIDDPAKPVKILAQGEISHKLTVVANKFSAKAAEKIQQAGGTAEQA